MSERSVQEKMKVLHSSVLRRMLVWMPSLSRWFHACLLRNNDRKNETRRRCEKLRRSKHEEITLEYRSAPAHAFRSNQIVLPTTTMIEKILSALFFFSSSAKVNIHYSSACQILRSTKMEKRDKTAAHKVIAKSMMNDTVLATQSIQNLLMMTT